MSRITQIRYACSCDGIEREVARCLTGFFRARIFVDKEENALPLYHKDPHHSFIGVESNSPDTANAVPFLTWYDSPYKRRTTFQTLFVGRFKYANIGHRDMLSGLISRVLLTTSSMGIRITKFKRQYIENGASEQHAAYEQCENMK